MPARLSPKKIESIRLLYMRSIATSTIAEQIGCSRNTVDKLAASHGWERPKVQVLSPRQNVALKSSQNGSPNVNDNAVAWEGDMLLDCRERLIALRATPCYAVDEHHRAAQALKLLDDIGRRALGLDQSSQNVRFTLQVLNGATPKPLNAPNQAQVVDAQIVEAKSSEPVEIEQKEGEKPNPS